MNPKTNQRRRKQNSAQTLEAYIRRTVQTLPSGTEFYASDLALESGSTPHQVGHVLRVLREEGQLTKRTIIYSRGSYAVWKVV